MWLGLMALTQMGPPYNLRISHWNKRGTNVGQMREGFEKQKEDKVESSRV